MNLHYIQREGDQLTFGWNPCLAYDEVACANDEECLWKEVGSGGYCSKIYTAVDGNVTATTRAPTQASLRTQELLFYGNYSEVVWNKTLFLEECQDVLASFNFSCIDVEENNENDELIEVEIQGIGGAEYSIDEMEDYIGMYGLNLTSFRYLTLEYGNIKTNYCAKGKIWCQIEKNENMATFQIF